MIIVFRSEAGYTAVKVDKFGISFANGEAYFSDGITEYVIPIEYIMIIQEAEN